MHLRLIVTLLIAVTVIVFGQRAALAEPTRAKPMVLESAFPSRPLHGPLVAQGVVIWSHGRSITDEDYRAPTPLYLDGFHYGIWDVYRFNRLRDADALISSARRLVGFAEELKNRGYKRVVVAGQSFGAFLSLMAARDAPDGVISAAVGTAPAAFGSFSESHDTFQDNARELYPILEKIRRARVALFYFHNDDFDPGGRGDRSREILRRNGVSHLLVDQPRKLVGHIVAAGPEFSATYGECIRNFLEVRIGAEAARIGCYYGDVFWGIPQSQRAELAP